MPLVGIKVVVSAVDQRGGSAVLELQQRRAAALGRPRRIQHGRLRAHAPNQTAAEQAHDIDLMGDLIKENAAASRRIELLRATRAIQKVGVVETMNHSETTEHADRK